MEAQKHVRAHTGASHSMVCRMLSLIFVTKAPREGTSQSELGLSGGVPGGGRVGPELVGFSGYPPSGARQNAVAKWPRFRPFWVSGFLDVQRKKRPPLMLLMLAWACRLMLLMLVVCC